MMSRFPILPKIVERWMIRYLDYWHGKGEDHQYHYYRCDGCRKLVTWKMIAEGGCPCGLSNRLRPAVIRLRDKVKLLLFPFTVNRYWPKE